MMKLCKSCGNDYTNIKSTKEECSVCYWREYNKIRWQIKKLENPKKAMKYLRDAQKKYRELNQEKIKQYAHTYNQKNKEKISEYQKKYYLEKTLPKRRATRKYVYAFEQMSVEEMKEVLDQRQKKIIEGKK